MNQNMKEMKKQLSQYYPDDATLTEFALDCIKQYGKSWRALHEFKEIANIPAAHALRIFHEMGISHMDPS